MKRENPHPNPKQRDEYHSLQVATRAAKITLRSIAKINS